MAPKAHSDFPASSAARLLTCPGSYELGLAASTGERKSSVYSAEGTLAHAISEACLVSGANPDSFVGRTESVDGFTYTVDQEFADAVGVYVDFIRGLRAMGYLVMLEQRVSPQDLWTGLTPLPIDLFGTSDCIAVHPGLRRMVIGDLKFGKGVAVEATGNPQLLYYGGGSMAPHVVRGLCDQFGVPPFDIEEVELVVIQPRAPHINGPIRREIYTADEVRDWSRINLYNGVKRALEDKGQTFQPSEYCRWCPARVGCNAMLEFAAETSRRAFLDAPIENIPADEPTAAILPLGQMSDEKLADLLDRISIVKPWMESVVALGQERLEAGASLRGWKLVPKRALRTWGGTEDEISAALSSAGIPSSKFMTSKLKSPAQVEKEVGKATYAQLVQPLVGKSSSGLTLAKDGDPRQRVTTRTAKDAFSGLTAN